MKFPKILKSKREERLAKNSLRELPSPNSLIDFSSNDYLGFANSASLFDTVHTFLLAKNLKQNGSTGSRLLSGNHTLYTQAEDLLCSFFKSDAALIFNSGYNANLGFFSAIPQKGDLILYDELVHASIREGIQLSLAKAFKFKHNDVSDLSDVLNRNKPEKGEVYIITESVFSMDGDTPDLIAFATLCVNHNYHLVVDEAHAVGVHGQKGEGLVSELNLEKQVFARIITFGKALGSHGAAILASPALKEYLINFARSFIYTTGLPPHNLATIICALNELRQTCEKEELQRIILVFKEELKKNKFEDHFIKSSAAIHSCLLPGNKKAKSVAVLLASKGFDVKAILSPTVPKGEERLRFCLHSYNTVKEVKEVLELLITFVK